MMIEKIIAGNEKAMDFEPQMVEYPTNLGFPAPLPARHYELAISGKQNEKREAIPHILKIIENNGVSVVSMSFSNNHSLDHFVMNVVCDMSSANLSQDDLLIRVNKSKFVKIAEMSPLEGRVFGKFAFPLTFFGEIRALAIDSDRFVHLFEDLTKAFGPKAKDSLFENGRREGVEVIEALKEKLGERWAKDRPTLIENAKALLQTAGWGKILFHNEGAEIYKVTIRDPPSDADENAILNNYFLHGMIAGVLESFLKEGIELSMIREGYEADKNNLLLYYMDKASIKELSDEDEDAKENEMTAIEKEAIPSAAPSPKQNSVESRKPRQRASELRPPEQKTEVEAATQVKQIIKSIEQIREVIVEEKATAVVEAPKQPVVSGVTPIQGEMIGYGVQIVSQPARRPPSKERKKNPSTDNNRKEYSSTDSVQF